MARIRTIKPEAFSSESLAEVSLTAERTFFGLLTLADDHGRYRDQAAVIRGQLWALRPAHSPLGVEDDLVQLAGAGLICRYTGPDGKAYLHIASWRRHQRIDRPSRSRYPACPLHSGAAGGQPADEPTASVPGRLDQHSANVPRQPDEPSPNPRGALDEPSRPPREEAANREIAGQAGVDEGSANPHRGLVEPSTSPHRLDLGPRILDQGSTPTGGADAPTPDTASARQLIAEHVAGCANRPPRGVLAHLGREAARLLDEGIDPRHVRAGLERFRARPMHPSVLPSLVNEAMNAPARTQRGHVPWTNPTDPAAYAGEL